MRNILVIVVEEIITYILCSLTHFPENRAFCQITWKNTAERGSSQMTVRRMRIEWWLPKDTNTLSEYVILIAFLNSSKAGYPY